LQGIRKLDRFDLAQDSLPGIEKYRYVKEVKIFGEKNLYVEKFFRKIQKAYIGMLSYIDHDWYMKKYIVFLRQQGVLLPENWTRV